MPYVRCPGCAMHSYSAAGHSTTDTCPRCGTPLTGGVRWSRAGGVLPVRMTVIEDSQEADAGGREARASGEPAIQRRPA